VPGASRLPERGETCCYCCNQRSHPERLDVRADSAQVDRWRFVEVAGQGGGTHIITHQRSLCCVRHARAVRDVLAAQRDRTRAQTHAALAEVYGWACGDVAPEWEPERG
jgi:hypothetical protein